MDKATFLAGHEAGMGRMFGIRFLVGEPDRVVAEAPVARALMAREGVVHGGLLMAMADQTSAYGAVLNLPPGCTTATIESKTNFLRAGTGDILRAEARPLHIGRRTSIWRATITRGPGDPIADVTQTQLYFEESAPGTTVAAPVPEAAPGPKPAHNTAPAPNIADERRRQIFEGACQVIAHKGFANATIREIAAAAGMPVPTMYQYIKRKEDLLALIYEFFMADYRDALSKGTNARDPAKRIEAAVRQTLDNFDRNHRYIKLMFQETRALDPADRARVFALDTQYIDVWTRLLEQAGARKRGRLDAVLAANFIYFLCTIWPLRYWSIGKYGRDNVADAISRFVLDGLGLSRAAKH